MAVLLCIVFISLRVCSLKKQNWQRSGLYQRHTADFTNAMNDASLPLVPSVEPREIRMILDEDGSTLLHFPPFVS